MRLEIFHVDAFSSGVFGGNPAAVVPLDRWLADDVMQAIAAENNLSETAFYVPTGVARRYELRWFTPVAEVDLCGHATLAAGHVLLGREAPAEGVRFVTRQAGELEVRKHPVPGMISMDFPSRPPRQVEDEKLRKAVEEAVGVRVEELWLARDLIARVADEAAVRAARPDGARIAAIDAFAVVVTARGTDCDFVSRFFAPRLGIPEDPVTGSAHCSLVPYWADVLKKRDLHARQLSARGGELFCRVGEGRVYLAGFAVTYLSGAIEVPG